MNFYTKLLKRGVLQLVGPDTRTFLQGQTTCDFTRLSPQRSISGAHCTPQGRMVCDFRAVAINGEDCLLSMRGDICAASAEVFGKYIVFSRSELSDASERWCVFALWGDRLPTLREGPDENGAIWSRVDEAGRRWECHCPATEQAALSATLAVQAERKPESAWQLAEINAGIGHIEMATVGMFIPQMLNYQATGHVSFSKGCYTGQEVVARLHYRGKLKRPMHLADVPGGAPVAGAPLFTSDREQSVGNVVNAVKTGPNSRLLAVCASDAVVAGARLGGRDGPALSFLPLPYSLDAGT